MAARTIFGIERRKVLVVGYALAAWIGAWLLLVVPLRLVAPHFRADLSPLGWALVRTGVTILACAWTVPFVLRIWRIDDEYRHAAAKFAWYWGGSLGLLMSLPAYVFLANAGLRWVWPAGFQWGLTPARAFQIGYLLPVVFQVVGLFVAAGWWRWGRRSAP